MCHALQSLDVGLVEPIGEVRNHGEAALGPLKPEGNSRDGAGAGAGDRGKRRPLPSHIGGREGAAEAHDADQGAEREIG